MNSEGEQQTPVFDTGSANQSSNNESNVSTPSVSSNSNISYNMNENGENYTYNENDENYQENDQEIGEDEAPSAATVDAEGSSIQIGPGPAQIEEEEAIGFELGDEWSFMIPKYHGKVTGIIYYLDENLMRILPNGISNLLYDIPFVDGNFDPDLQITEAPVLRRRNYIKNFVDLMKFEAGETIHTLSARGETGSSFRITNVYPDTDAIQIEDSTTASRSITFNFIGIPLEESFAIVYKEYTVEEEKQLTPEEIETIQREKEYAMTPLATTATALGQDTDELEDLGDVEIEDIIYFKDIEQKDVMYPEISQKEDMLVDMLSLLDGPSQQNPLLLKRIRSLVESMSALKNSIIDRAEDGRPMGEITTLTIQSLLDIVKQTHIPMVRPILQTKRVITFDIEGEESNQEQVIVLQLKDLVTSSEEFLENLGNIQAQAQDGGGGGIPRWFQVFQRYFAQFPMGDFYPGGSFTLSSDLEYFRITYPGEASLLGLPELTDGYKGKYISNFLTNIDQSYRRGHGPTVRSMEKGGVETAIHGDSANVNGYIIFPLSATHTGTVGSIRPGTLKDAMLRSHAPKISLNGLIRMYDGITVIKQANKIMYITPNDTDATLISFADYFQQMLQTTIPTGPGDFLTVRHDLGIQDKELTIDQQRIFQERVKEVVGAIRGKLNTIREEMDQEPAKPVTRPVLESSFLATSLQMIQSNQHTILEEIAKAFASRTPGYKQVDVALMASMMKYAPDYFLAVLSGQPLAIDKERIRAIRQKLLQTLQDAMELDALQSQLGLPPKQNPCAHVSAMHQARKTPDENERFALLSAVVMKFRGNRVDNWEMCWVCKEPLICHHEILQIQQVTHPLEKSILQKEIVLHYAGGPFGRNHICRNCGGNIQEIEYDKGLEFDDDGKPMMGRSELIDKDALRMENVELLFGLRPQTLQTFDFGDTQKNTFYSVAKVITDAIGIDLDGPTMRTLVERASAAAVHPDLFINKNAYNLKKKKTPSYKDYSDYHSQEIIALVGSLVLIAIQSSRPSLVPKFVVEGCRAGFDGFPLLKEATIDPPNPDHIVGIVYMTCVLSGIHREEPMWMRSFLTYANVNKRKELITSFLLKYLKVLAQNISIQESLDAKRFYLAEQFGPDANANRPKDQIPAGFLPKQHTLQEEKELSAQSPVVAEGVRGALGDILKADVWIRAVHELAAKHTNIIRGSPFAETACCFDSVIQPGAFWRQAQLPRMPDFYSTPPGTSTQTILYPPMLPRTILTFSASPPLNKAYLVFFKLCWRGPREGLSHELGYDHTCDWCGVHIPTNYLYPDVDKDGNLFVRDESGKPLTGVEVDEAMRIDLEGQGISITEQSLQALLDRSHQLSMFNRYVPPVEPSGAQILDRLNTIQPPLVPSWQTSFATALENLKRLQSEASEIEIAAALQPISQALEASEVVIQTVLPRDEYQACMQIINQESMQGFFSTLEQYFLLPAQRILTSYNLDTLKVSKYFKLSTEHGKLLTGIIGNHLGYISQFSELLAQEEQTKAQYKLATFVRQLSTLLSFSSELRISRIRYDDKVSFKSLQKLLQLILRVCLFGPLSDCMNEAVGAYDEEGDELDVEEGRSTELLRGLFRYMIQQYIREKTSVDEETIRLKIESAVEEEKQTFIMKLDRMSDEEKRLELVKKRFGLGDWSIGGTKLIYQYNAAYWDKTYLDRLSYEQRDQADLEGNTGPTAEEYGMEDQYMQDEGGYDFNQHADDDYE